MKYGLKRHCCGSPLAADIDDMCVKGCGCGELMHWWSGALKAASSLLFVPPFFHHPILPHRPAASPSSFSSSLSLFVSFHLCHYCPLSNLIIQALYSPLLCLCVFPLSFTLMSLSLALVGCCGQTSRSNLALPLFLCLSFFSLHWLYISCALSLISNFCLCLSSQIYFLLFPLLVSVNSVSYGSEIVSIVFITMCGWHCVDKKIEVLYKERRLKQ